MERPLEEYLLQAIRTDRLDTVSEILSKGANPNKTVSSGMTCLGEAANMGNIELVKVLISATKKCHSTVMSATTTSTINSRKHYFKDRNRKVIKNDVGQCGESSVKCKNLNERLPKKQTKCIKPNLNHGYFVFIHNESSSTEENQATSLNSPISPSSLTLSPQEDLEWDEEIGNVAATTTEDETLSSIYKWYAAILENSGAAIAAASQLTNGIDQQDAYTRTALHYAADNGHFEVVKALVDAGCKIDTMASNGLSSLHLAVLKNYIEIVRVMLDAGGNVNSKSHDKMSPLHFAAARGFLDMVKLLLKNGAHLEARDSIERTALYLAAGRGHVDVVKHLICCGANVNAEQMHGYTPLCEAVWVKYTPVVEVLLECGARIIHSHDLLYHSIVHKQEDIAKLLINHGGGINLHNDIGDTPLLLAIRTSQLNIVRMLLQRGANVNSSNSITGLNAVHLAVENVEPEKFGEMLECLIEYHIDINETALIGDTPLNWALL